MVEVRYIHETAEFSGLREVWDSLLQESEQNNPFLTHEWLFSWWQAFGDTAELKLVLFYERIGQAEKLIGIFPGYIRREGCLPRMHKLRLLGSEVVTSDFLDIIVAQGKSDAVYRSFFSELEKQNQFNLVELTDLPDNSPFHSENCLPPGSRWKARAWQVNKICPFVKLPNDSETYFAGLGKNTRKRYRYRRKLESEGARLEIVRQRCDLPQAIEDFRRLHTARRRQKKQPGIFATREQQLFYPRVFERFFDAGWLEIAFLRVGEERLATVCQFNYGDRIYYYQTGYDISWSQSRVGFVLICLLIEDAIRQGKDCYEFLRGEEEYKYQFGAKDGHQLKDLYFKNGALPGEIFLGRKKTIADGKALLKKMLPLQGRSLKRGAL